MSKLPKEIKLTRHALLRLEERKDPNNYYNFKNIMKSSCKWYTKDDFILNSDFYLHCLYMTRKSTQIGYITDGKIEIVYNKGTGVAITVMKVKEKFLPIIQYVKPEILEEIERKKEIKKMRKKLKTKIGICKDCDEVVEINAEGVFKGLCARCKTRKQNAKAVNKTYIPYKDLSDEEKARIDAFRESHNKNKTIEKPTEIKPKEIEKPVIEETPIEVEVKEETVETPVQKTTPVGFNPLADQRTFINILRECGCEIPEQNLKDVLDVLVATDKLKDICLTITKGTNQDAMLNLEQALNVVERKLQHNWEYNGFQEADDIKFKGFLTWRRVLKGSIYFWKKLYQTNTLIELQKAWTAYIADPNEKVLLSGDRINTTQKRFQITTDSISTIFNTRRAFTRVFYANSKEEAYEKFTKWMAERQLHEDKTKTTIVELTTEGEDGRK